MSVLWRVLLALEELKCVLTTPGALFAAIHGMMLMLQLLAIRQDTHSMVQ